MSPDARNSARRPPSALFKALAEGESCAPSYIPTTKHPDLASSGGIAFMLNCTEISSFLDSYSTFSSLIILAIVALSQNGPTRNVLSSEMAEMDS